ncbi:hypothetical protein SAMN05192539_101867 [Paraburkholderia diazotrophica]|uniref:Uncharacterized protein n=1 Tax=Paraburkholderia diazotrophica TaxID=667676 RepID=A0A1H7BV50_9BURK|nr:hypothetical protein SAMN05192539_101867 [Paraburkholderia diazotrophica]
MKTQTCVLMLAAVAALASASAFAGGPITIVPAANARATFPTGPVGPGVSGANAGTFSGGTAGPAGAPIPASVAAGQPAPRSKSSANGPSI